jgi:hypothetical protein
MGTAWLSRLPQSEIDTDSKLPNASLIGPDNYMIARITATVTPIA